MIDLPQNSLMFLRGTRLEPPRAVIMQMLVIEEHPVCMGIYGSLPVFLDDEVRALSEDDGVARNVLVLYAGVGPDDYVIADATAPDDLAVAHHEDAFTESGVDAVVVANGAALREREVVCVLSAPHNGTKRMVESEDIGQLDLVIQVCGTKGPIQRIDLIAHGAHPPRW